MHLLEKQINEVFFRYLWTFNFSHFKEGFLDHFIEWRMKTKEIHIFKNILASLFILKPLITTLKSLQIAINRNLSINNGIFRIYSSNKMYLDLAYRNHRYSSYKKLFPSQRQPSHSVLLAEQQPLPHLYTSLVLFHRPPNQPQQQCHTCHPKMANASNSEY